MELKKVFILFLILPIILVSIAACASNKSVPSSPSPEPTATQETAPKLDSRLILAVVMAQGAGGEEWAKQHGVELVNGRVEVEIEAMPGQLDAAVASTSAVGTVEIVARRSNGLDALVPIDKLRDLSREPIIRMIRNPTRPVFP